VAGGRHFMPWIHVDDIAGIYARAVEDERWSGPINACAPEPPTNAEFSKALGRALHRPAVLPIPGLVMRLLYGERAQVVTTGQRVVSERLLALGYELRHPELEPALRAALGY
jgi:NAD dependent epimerase/dehydratase family enzyme